MRFDNAEGTIVREVKVIDDLWVTERTEDFQPVIDEVLRRRVIYDGKISHRDTLMSCAFLVPDALVELLYQHGIKVIGGGPSHFNFVHDWLKANFPCFLIHPNKNLKISGEGMAEPTYPIELNKRFIKQH